MLPPIATIQELRDRIQGGVPPADEARAEAALSDASVLIRQVAGLTWEVDAPPDVAVMVALHAAKRCFLNPDEVRSESIDNYATSYGDVYLTKDEVAMVRKSAGATGLWVQPVTRSEDDILDTPSVTQDSLTMTQDAESRLDAGDLSDFFA